MGLVIPIITALVATLTAIGFLALDQTWLVTALAVAILLVAAFAVTAAVRRLTGEPPARPAR